MLAFDLFWADRRLWIWQTSSSAVSVQHLQCILFWTGKDRSLTRMRQVVSHMTNLFIIQSFKSVFMSSSSRDMWQLIYSVFGLHFPHLHRKKEQIKKYSVKSEQVKERQSCSLANSSTLHTLPANKQLAKVKSGSAQILANTSVSHACKVTASAIKFKGHQ